MLLLVLLGLLSPGAALADPESGTRPPHTAESPASLPASQPVSGFKVLRVQDMLISTIALYQRSEFDKARAMLKEILSYVGQERTRLAQEAYTYQAFVHVAYGEKEKAVTAFERALSINPELTLPAGAPKIRSAFQQAQQRHRAKIRALDHDPPALRHTPPQGGKYGRALSIEAAAIDPSGVKKVVLNHRQAGNRGFSSVTMERKPSGRFVATIPAIHVARPGVEYFLTAWDVLGNGPGLKGSSGVPIRVPVEGGPAASGQSQERPWYKNWWVWTAVAGAVAITGGIAAGVYVSRDKSVDAYANTRGLDQ